MNKVQRRLYGGQCREFLDDLQHVAKDPPYNIVTVCHSNRSHRNDFFEWPRHALDTTYKFLPYLFSSKTTDEYMNIDTRCEIS